MGQSFFIWKNADCRSMGITLPAPPQIIRGEERVSHVTIPGRAGELTLTEGDNIYQSYIQTVTIQGRGAYRMREILNWLKGDGYVTFGGEPDRRQKARVIGAVSMNRHSKNTDWWTGEVQWYCQPLKELLNEPKVTISSSGSSVLNAGDVQSRPKITATANATSLTITAGGNTLTVTGLTSGQKYIIDSDIMEVTDNAGTTILTQNSTGDFPMLEPGSNTITGSGWSSLEIDRRERFM